MPRVRTILTMVLIGVVGGALLAGVALPPSITGGVLAKLASEEFERLPSALRMPPNAQTSYLYAADGRTVITQFWTENRTDVAGTEIAAVMKDAIVAAEDTRFRTHGGVDLKGLARAFVSNAGGGETQGASTLTMQYVRNVLKNDPTVTEEERRTATAQTSGRKLQEIRYAISVDEELGKDEILRRYLNIAYFGHQAYGVAAAAQTYFSTTPDRLTLGQAAMIAGLVKSPDAYDPIDNDEAAARGRRDYVLGAMVGTGAISREEADRARAEPLGLKPGPDRNSCAEIAAEHNNWGFFCNYLVSWWKEQPEFGSTPSARYQALKTGGFRITAAMDPALQDAAAAEATRIHAADRPQAVPFAAIEPGTGRVRALAVNRVYGIAPNPLGRAYPHTVQQLVAGGPTVPGYRFGAPFLLFAMLAALENGHPMDDRMRSAFGRSSHDPFLELHRAVGPDRAVDVAERLGLVFRAAQDAKQAATPETWHDFPRGLSASTPLEMANAYATLAADGLHCVPNPVTSITAAHAGDLPARAAEPDCTRALAPDVARTGLDAARCPVGDRPGGCDGGTSAQAGQLVGRPVAGKSGDATGSFVAVTPQLAVAAVAANPDNPDELRSADRDAVTEAVARLLHDALRDRPVEPFPAP